MVLEAHKVKRNFKKSLWFDKHLLLDPNPLEKSESLGGFGGLRIDKKQMQLWNYITVNREGSCVLPRQSVLEGKLPLQKRHVKTTSKQTPLEVQSLEFIPNQQFQRSILVRIQVFSS